MIRTPGREVSLLNRPGAPWLTNAALMLFGLLVIEFCHAGIFEFTHYTFGFSADVFGQLVLYFGAIALIERCPTDRWTLVILFAVAIVARLVCIFHPPFLSTDVYRYVWDGKVQAAGINPFRYIPADGHLSFLRDSAIYPHINRKDYAHTIYPPGAQAIFYAITRLGASEPLMKLGMVAFEAATCFVLMRIMKLLQLPRERIVLYAWNPLCFWEIASSGHVDAAALTFISLALYACLRNRSTQAGAWLGVAALVKIYPAFLLPALLGWPIRKREWRMAAVMFSVILFGYACYASVGAGVFGFLPEYAHEEGLETGNRYFPLTFLNRMLHTTLPAGVYIVLCGLFMLGVCVWAVRRSPQEHAVVFSSLVIATALNLCFAPHYPWYFLWLLPPLVIFPWRPSFYLVSAATFLFSTQLGAPGEPMYLLNKLLYGGFFLMLAYDLLQRYLSAHVRVLQPSCHHQHLPRLTEQLADAREL